MSSNTSETVKRARELMDLGVDPMVLMSQMATLIMDIIAGTYQVVEARYGDSLFGGRSCSSASDWVQDRDLPEWLDQHISDTENSQVKTT
ncbi:hypothetical protein HanHA89_Chr05g0172131 [Helianthus annuus]|nr:hypothetical protein HanHA89_Chr05g0172131 [Helianthus annuus]